MRKITTPISWSQKVVANKCLRAWFLGYIERLERIPGVSHLNRIRGSAFHAAVEAAFLFPEEQVIAAIKASDQYLVDNTIKDKTVWDYEQGEYLPDNDYYDMMAALRLELPGIIQYHIPLIGINTRYKVATSGKVFGEVEDIPLLEYHIETEGGHGYIDAILIDMESGRMVLADWKLRAKFERDAVVQVDGQLMFYAALLRQRGIMVTEVIQWQFKKKTPSPASISKKTKKPNTGAKTYDTTWEEWCRTLPTGIDPAKYEEEMKPKLKGDDAYQSIVSTIVSDTSCALSLADMDASVKLLDFATVANIFPAVQSSMACQYCDFLMLCSAPLKHGGISTEIIDAEYRRKE